jgi:hypothetical protein
VPVQVARVPALRVPALSLNNKHAPDSVTQPSVLVPGDHRHSSAADRVACLRSHSHDTKAVVQSPGFQEAVDVHLLVLYPVPRLQKDLLLVPPNPARALASSAHSAQHPTATEADFGSEQS